MLGYFKRAKMCAGISFQNVRCWQYLFSVDIIIKQIEFVEPAGWMVEIGECYRTLKLDEDCSDLELRRRYRQFALYSHPDKLKNSCIEQDSTNDSFLKFSEAYRRIVSYRKLRKNGQKFLGHRAASTLKKATNIPTLTEIRDKLVLLNSTLFEQSKETVDPFIKSLDAGYQQHLSILQSLNHRLNLMKEKRRMNSLNHSYNQ